MKDPETLADYIDQVQLVARTLQDSKGAYMDAAGAGWFMKGLYVNLPREDADAVIALLDAVQRSLDRGYE